MTRLPSVLFVAASLAGWASADASSSAAPVVAQAGRASAACALLKLKYPAQTLFAGSDAFTNETRTQYWSATTYQDPACVFVPQTAQQVSHAVTTLTLTLTRFAVRGGGHMPIVGANSIGPEGVLLSTAGLAGLSLSADGATVSVGAGHRWRDVYGFLAPHGRAAVGGRIGGVGVGGLLLGGGISFHSSQYGFASDNIASVQAVLASGAIVEATPNNAHADLYWALRGGGNSFAIVTRFNLRTVPTPAPGVWVGIAQYSPADSEAYLDAVTAFASHGADEDPKAAIIPTIVALPAYGITAYAAARFYDSAEDSPTAFANFTAPVLAPIADSYARQPLADYVRDVDALQPTGLRQEFRVLSILADRPAVSLVHDAFVARVASLAAVAGLTGSITFQPVTPGFLARGRARAGPNPQGVDASRAPYLWIVMNLSWQSADDDVTARAFADALTADLEAELTARDVAGKYLYLNDAGPAQPVFQSYPANNLARLKAIRARYDPLRIYTNLLVGGWKVLSA